jgi:formylglycine-generating enzyme required for sulfatase activity
VKRFSSSLLPALASVLLGLGLTAALRPGAAAPAPPAKSFRVIENSIGMKLVYAPPGKFRMGSPTTEAGRDGDEGPERIVELTQPYYLGTYEVTQAEFERVMGHNPSYFSPGGAGAAQVAGLDTRNFPVEMVSWVAAQDFCLRLSRLPKEMAARRVYRLPTEAEWEYACRAGAGESVPFGLGRCLSSLQANCDGNQPYGATERGPRVGRPVPVGSYKKPNVWGLHDMHGNVAEWCFDYYDSSHYRNAETVDPQGPLKGTSRVIRGGAFNSAARICRSAYRVGSQPTTPSSHIGFRVLCEVAR